MLRTEPLEPDAVDQSRILEELHENGPRALAAYFECYRERLRNVVNARIDRRLLPRVDSSDVIQEAFLTAVNRLDEYMANPAMSLYPWLRFLTRQHAIAVHRHHFHSQKRDPSREAATGDPRVETLMAQLTEEVRSPQSEVITAEARRRIRELLNQLTEHDREILTLVHLHQQSVAEAAKTLNLPGETARKRHFRAMKRLKSIADQLQPDLI
ncbi:MAG: sigma-70 family RNA polymerase sigma factor [Planctomycetaceae bacterium]|nr:sigma-70 family RNA polymerase sigma factor [Planctomycetaceae bacterium]